MTSILPLIWIGIIAFGIVMYVILDGFTLGTGMLMPLMNAKERDIAVSAILPTWDGNQTWLVFGGASLYGAFPLAFSALLPVLYLPLLLMLIGLLFRGVVFEFRLKSRRGRHHWDRVFAAASLLVTLIQGQLVGNFVEGFAFSQHAYMLPARNLFTAFGLFTGVSLVFGYALLGSTRLILKTEGALQAKMYRIARLCAWIIAACMLVVSLWTPFINEFVFRRWFAHHHWLYLSFLPLLTAACFLILLQSLYKRNDRIPYYISIGLFLCPYLGFIISLYPFIVPYQITIWDAASPTSSLVFLLVGALIMLPVLLFYTGYAYRIFRGKVREMINY